jgi:hypothetical protein
MGVVTVERDGHLLMVGIKLRRGPPSGPRIKPHAQCCSSTTHGLRTARMPSRESAR